MDAVPKGDPSATDPPLTDRFGGPVQLQLLLKSSSPLEMLPIESRVNPPTVASGAGMGPPKLKPHSRLAEPEEPVKLNANDFPSISDCATLLCRSSVPLALPKPSNSVI